MKRAELPKDFYIDFYCKLPAIDRRDVRLLWHSRFYDGPLDGLCLFQGRKCWFEIFRGQYINEVQQRTDTDGTVWTDYFVYYLLIELSENQVTEEEYWHELFREYVGTHTDYDENGSRKLGVTRPQEMWSQYYDAKAQRKPHDFSNNRIHGWFRYLCGTIEENELISET